MSTLSVFEHQTVRVGQELSAQQFDALVRLNDRAQARLFDVGHRRITFCQFVGYLQVGELGIEVLPKADRGARPGAVGPWHTFLLEMLRAATGIRLQVMPLASQRLAHASLLDVVVWAFAEEISSLVRAGLAKGYRSAEANEPVFRGKLLVREHMRTNHGRADRVYAQFHLFDTETMLNRLLVTALDAVEGATLNGKVADAVRRARAAMPALPVLPEVQRLFAGIRLGRSTARYAKALLLARMILDQRMPELRSGKTAVLSLMFDMNVLWERFVTASIRRVGRDAGVDVEAQATSPFWKVAGKSARTIRPDIVLRDKMRPSRACLIADTKWKRLDGSGPSDADLHQMFAYGEVLRCDRAVLLYPAGGNDPKRMAGHFETGRRCEAVELALVDGSGKPAKSTIERQLSELVRVARD